MSESEPAQPNGSSLADLKTKVLQEISAEFRASVSPRVSEADLHAGVDLLFQTLAHRIGDVELDAVGGEIEAGLRRWFDGRDLVKLADRCEPFCKFILGLIAPDKFAQLQAEAGNRLMAAKVLKALGLVSNKALSAFADCRWEQFPPQGVVGQPDFLEHVARTYVFRNAEDHAAPGLNSKQKAEIAESVCVLLVWSVIKHRQQIGGSLMIARFDSYLSEVRKRFEDIGRRFVELTTEKRSPQEYRFLDPLGPSPTATSSGGQNDASRLPEFNRVTVIEAEPGAGKTFTLQFVAWKQAEALLRGEASETRIPVYVEARLLSHRCQHIETAVQQVLAPTKGEPEPIPWNSLLLLVDGINEVAAGQQDDFKAELRDLLSRFTELRVVLAGRPNSFRGEFEANVVVLRPLSEDQVAVLFERALGDADRATELSAAVRRSPFPSLWVRTPLHASMAVALTGQGGMDALADHPTAVRWFVRRFLEREKTQNRAQTPRLAKEALLAGLAFETMNAVPRIFGKAEALSVLQNRKGQLSATNTDLPRFIHEVLDNGILQLAGKEDLEFAYELYHDYFAATELEAREQRQAGLGVDFALAHFSDIHWAECIRLFAGYSNVSSVLVERGAEKNPLLAWRLLKDAGGGTPELAERVTDAAYCVLAAELNSETKAAMAGGCICVLAGLSRADLLERAVGKLRRVFDPGPLPEATDAEKEAALGKQKQVASALCYGLLSLVRAGLMEQELGQEGRFCQAARSAIRGLERIKAVNVLCVMLSEWTGSTFGESALIPGAVLDALLRLGVDEVLDRENKSMNQVLALSLKRASETGLAKAWPAYGRVLRLARRVYVADTGLEFDAEAAFKWLRLAHDAGDRQGTLELALLLVEEPRIANEPGQGERMLRESAQTSAEARYELGRRLLRGGDLPKNEAEGLKHLLSAAESGHAGALSDLQMWFVLLRQRTDEHLSQNDAECFETFVSAAESGHARALTYLNQWLIGLLVVGPPLHSALPTWARSYRHRLQALFPSWPMESG